MNEWSRRWAATDFRAPPALDIGLAARAAGWHHWTATDGAGFAAALAQAGGCGGPRLIEAVIDRHASVLHHKTFWQAAQVINAALRHDGGDGLRFLSDPRHPEPVAA